MHVTANQDLLELIVGVDVQAAHFVKMEHRVMSPHVNVCVTRNNMAVHVTVDIRLKEVTVIHVNTIFVKMVEHLAQQPADVNVQLDTEAGIGLPGDRDVVPVKHRGSCDVRGTSVDP